MKKNKKKHPSGHDKKIALAHCRNNYISRIKKVLNEINMEDIFHELSPELLEIVFTNRGQFISVQHDEKKSTSKSELKEIQKIIYEWSRDQKVQIFGSEFSINIIDFFEVWVPLVLNIKSIDNRNSQITSKINDIVFETFIIYTDFDNQNFLNQNKEAYNKRTDILTLFALIASLIRTKFIWLELSTNNCEIDYGLRQKAILHSSDPEITYFKKDNKNRPIYRLGIPFTNIGIVWAQISPSTWDLNTDNETKLDVYIQSHAINRMCERIDGLNEQGCIINLYNSIINNPKAIIYNNDILIEYLIEDLKIGYVLATQQKNRLIIRTFLFITANGTPEGQKLSEITGLGKLDKKFLAIDKFSAFQNSGIKDNPRLADIFINAGCGDLLHVEILLKYFQEIKNSPFTPELLLRYLGVSENDDQNNLSKENLD